MKNTLALVVLLILALATIFCLHPTELINDKNQHESGGLNSIRGMSTKRAAHTATLLADGRVLIAGGFVDTASLSSAEVFDPATKSFASAGDMGDRRSGHTATLLSNGKVLVAGGYNGSYLATAELYEPETRSFKPTGKMLAARSSHVAVLLPDGKVLLAGGVGTGWTFLASAEIYDPVTDIFTATGNMHAARESHTATSLANGKVLIAGGHKGRRSAMTVYSSAEIYDSTSGSFTAAGDMTRIRHKHDAVLLADGRVLIVGGADERDGRGAYNTTEIYDPAKETFTVAANMNLTRYKLQGTAILLNDGKVVVAGGANRAEIYDPSSNTFSYAPGDMGTARLFATATRLSDGKVLITGGYNNQNEVSSNAWLFRA